MEKKRVNSTKVKAFLKKNMYYFIMALCLIAVATMITITALNKNADDGTVLPPPAVIDETPIDVVPDPDIPVVVDPPVVVPPVVTPVVFASPVANINILQDYADDSLVWHSTLRHYAVHTAIDFGGADGDKVYAVYGGIVEKVEYDVLNGYVVTIKHSDTLKTVYGSMNEPTVVQGQSVVKGTALGTMGNTATKDYVSGAHLEFSVYENGKNIDPYTYLDIGGK